VTKICLTNSVCILSGVSCTCLYCSVYFILYRTNSLKTVTVTIFNRVLYWYLTSIGAHRVLVIKSALSLLTCSFTFRILVNTCSPPTKHHLFSKHWKNCFSRENKSSQNIMEQDSSLKICNDGNGFKTRLKLKLKTSSKIKLKGVKRH